MKKALLLIVAVATLFTGCGEIESDINNLKDRIDQLEQKVATIDEQIVAINSSIELLEKVDKELQAKDAQLEKKKKNLEAKIAELKQYITNELNSTKSWASATFATLEQYQSLLSEIVRLENILKSNKEAATHAV